MGAQNRQEIPCKGCGKITGSDGEQPLAGGDVYCSQCMVERAEKYIQDTPIEKPKLQRLRETRAWRIAMILIILLSLGGIGYQVPHLLTAFREPKPIRMGSDETDEATDKCIKNLWQISHFIQQGRSSAASGILCPASGKPYVISLEAKWEVHCPNPEAHGVSDIGVEKANPVPKLKK